MRSLFDQDPPEVRRLQIYTQFGFHGYHMVLTQSIQDTLAFICDVAEPIDGGFDAEMVVRWKVVNELLLTPDREVEGLAPTLTRYLPSVAATCAFPTLEELARRLSGRWDEDGVMFGDSTPEDGLYRRRRDGAIQEVQLRAGNRVVGLQHKLQLLRGSLHPSFRASIDSLDRLTQKSFIQGIDTRLSPMFERLAYYRNAWAHGSLYLGWEAHFVTLFIGLLYFRHVPGSGGEVGS